MFSDVKIEQLLQAAERKQAEAHTLGESGKAKVLRGGNSGVLTEDGDQFGKCSRISLLRYLGIESTPDLRSSYFFNAGHANETRWSELLETVGPGQQLAENEIPVTWSVKHPGTGEDVPVGGRPDIVHVEWDCDDQARRIATLRDIATAMDYKDVTAEQYLALATKSKALRDKWIAAGELTLKVGMELKKVCSSYRAVKAFLGVTVDADHLAQAAHYSWQLGKLPWIISYTSDSSYDIPGWVFKHKSEWLTDEFRESGKIPPGRKHFYTGWLGDKFCFVHPDTAQVVETAITATGIERYYQYVLAQEHGQQLGPRPSKDQYYEGSDNPDPCKWCDFKTVCKKYEGKDFNTWLDAAREAALAGGDDD